MLEKCTHMTAVSLHPTPTSQLDAYKRIIDQSDMVLAVYDSATPCGDDADSAMQYAVCKGNPLLLIHPDSRNTTVHFPKI